MRKNLIFLGAFIFLVAFLLLPFAGMERMEEGADFKVCFGPEPETLDPAIATGMVELQYISSLFEGLVSFEAKNPLQPAPGIAHSWSISPDQKTYTFFLRKNAKWSDGSPLGAKDFLYSWKRILEIKVDCKYAMMLYYIKNAEPYFRSHLAYLALKKMGEGISILEQKKLIQENLFKGARRDSLPKIDKFLQRCTNPSIRKALKKARSKIQSRPPLSFQDVGIKVMSPYVLKVTLENQTPYILELFGFPTFFPVPQKTIQKYKEDWTKPSHLIGNGPFVIDRWKPHYMITLLKNKFYHSAKSVSLQKVACMIIDQPTTALNYYVENHLDYLDKSAIPTDFVESLMKRKDFILNPTLGTTFLRFNVTTPPFDNVLVRKAFAMAIDKKEIELALRTGEPATNRLVPFFPGYEKLQPLGLSYNPKEAKKIFQKIYPDLSKFPKLSFLASSTGAKNRDVFLVIRNQLKRNLGVILEPKFQEWKVYLTSLSATQYHLGYGAWIGDYGDPNTFLDMWISGSGNNRTGWTNKEFDGWIQKAGTIHDPKKRWALFGRCEKLLLEEECVIVPLFFRTSYLMVKPKVKGVVPNVMQRFLIHHVRIQK